MVYFSGVTSEVPFNELFLFNKDEIAYILEDMGLMSARAGCQIERMDRYIFLHGDEQEVYNEEERKFIASVGDIYIFREFHKKTKRGIMPCRIIAAEIEAIDEVKSSIFFMKEINKAIGGFTIFFLKINANYFVGMRAFKKDSQDDCILSQPITKYEDYEVLAEQLYYVSESEDFIEYYSSLANSLEYVQNQIVDYDTKILIKRGMQFDYLQTLRAISQIYRVDFSAETERYYASFEEFCIDDSRNDIVETLTELSFIKSLRVNTMEMLFEAEEMAQLAAKTEDEYSVVQEQNRNIETESAEDSAMKEYLDDPELMIKLLKKKRGM